MIKLYGLGLSNNVNKVRYCLNHLGLQYEWQQINPFNGDNQTSEYLSIAPSGKIPAIEIDGFKLFESNAINRYLCVINNSDLYPRDAKKQAIVDSWTDYVAIHVAQAFGRVLFNRVLAPMIGQKADSESVRVGLEFLDKYFPVIEKQLSKNAYLAGDQFSLADINLLAVLDPCELAQIDISKYSRIIAWRKNLQAQPFYQKCYKSYSQFVSEAMSAQAGKS